ncbi:MAG: DUF4411 family protein [Proteobacteria bacterium]|nr:DUF4411 family protein [Pseudomonadota bacterium]
MDYKYIIDSNAFIEAKNRYYGFEICPGYWNLLEKAFNNDIVSLVQPVYKELINADDKLSEWIKQFSKKMVKPDTQTQQSFIEVVDYVENNYSSSRYKPEFLAKADPWIIAEALKTNATVITHEVYIDNKNSPKIKIPNICEHFEIRIIDIFSLIKELDERFVLERVKI